MFVKYRGCWVRRCFPKSIVVKFLVLDGNGSSSFVHSGGFLFHENSQVSSMFWRIAGGPDEFAMEERLVVEIGSLYDETGSDVGFGGHGFWAFPVKRLVVVETDCISGFLCGPSIAGNGWCCYASSCGDRNKFEEKRDAG